MLAAQGGRLDEGLPVSPIQEPVRSPASGHVSSIDALAVGIASLELGAGRARKEDRIDPAAGLVIEAPVGASMKVGDPLVTVHAASHELVAQVTPRLLAAWRMSEREVVRPPHVVARID
jgi:thymidine phosphorylase